MTRGFQLDAMGAAATELATHFPALTGMRWHQAMGTTGAVELLFDTGLSLLLQGKTVLDWSRSLTRLGVDAEELAWYLGVECGNPCFDLPLPDLLRKLASCLTPSLPSNEPVYAPAPVSANATAKLVVANYLR